MVKHLTFHELIGEIRFFVGSGINTNNSERVSACCDELTIRTATVEDPDQREIAAALLDQARAQLAALAAPAIPAES